MRRPQYLGWYILALLIIQAISISALYQFRQQELGSFISTRQTEIRGQYAMLTHLYDQRVQMDYEVNLAVPEVLTLMERASVAGPDEQDRLRQELYTMVLPLYRHLLDNSFQQVHFHFADGTSFLRMHQPLRFGDSLGEIRSSVALVNSIKKPVSGFEMGRSWQAYRFLYPLSSDGRHLGSVEIGIPFSTLLKNLMVNFPAEYRFIAQKQMVARHLDEDDLRDQFAGTSFSPEFVLENADQEAVEYHSHPENQGHVNQQQIDRIDEGLRDRLRRHLPAFQAASLPLFLDNQAFLVHLLPIKDVAGGNAGYLMAYEQSAVLLAMKWRYLLGHLLVTVFSLLFIGLHGRYTTRLFHRLEIQRQLRQQLDESHTELNQIFDSAADGMRLIGLDGVIKRANTTFAGMVHLPLDQVVGRPCHEVFAGDTCHTEKCPLYLIRNGTQYIENEQERATADGRAVFCQLVATPFYNVDGELIGIVEDFRDITERKRLEEQLQTLSITDELTGLCNRRGFMHLAQQQLEYVKRAGGEIFLVFADLDNMKWINDHLGHKAGDRALVLTARLLRTTIREADIVGRMGGDEFAVLFTSRSSSESEPVLLARLEEELAAINTTLAPEERIAISFGIAHNLGDATLDEIIAQADARMYAEKKRRKEARGA
jgi:diguanylate cyclase (GGDEF)-like protein/PAS domain S-box-containing protein